MKVWEYTEKDINETTNIGRELTLDVLLKDGIITEDQYTMYSEGYVIILIERGWFGKAIDKVFFRNEEEKHGVYKMVKIL